MGKCSNAFFSETTNMIKAKLYMNVHWVVLYKLYVFYSDMKFKMAATDVKTMSCSGSHLGITINIKNTKFVKDLPMIDAQFRFIQCNSLREEYISVFSPYGCVYYTCYSVNFQRNKAFIGLSDCWIIGRTPGFTTPKHKFLRF
jgi:hypothetical protein